MANMPGTGAAAQAGDTPNAGPETKQGTELDRQTDPGSETETPSDEGGGDPAADGAEEEGTETEEGAGEEQGQPSLRERQLQLQFDRSQTELGTLKKAFRTIIERIKASNVGGPTPEEHAADPDEAAKKEKALKDEDDRLESELRGAENRTEIARLVPDFEAHIPAVAEFFEKDGADPGFVESFKKDPHSINPVLAKFVTEIVRLRKSLARYEKGTKPAMPKPVDPKFTPTNDRAGRAPAEVRGPVNYKSIAESIAKDPSSVDEVLSKMSLAEINALLEEDKRAAQARRRRT